MLFAIMIGIGLAAGVLSVLLGVGGGIIMVPALIYFAKMEMKPATLTSLVVIIPTAVMGVFQRVQAERVDWRMVALVGAGAVTGAFLGGKLGAGASDKLLKQAFAILLIFTAVRMLLSTR